MVDHNMEQSQPPKPRSLTKSASFVVGGLLLIWLSYIHFRLWHDFGYRHIPTIGPLFLAQSIAGLVLGLLVMVVRRVWVAVVSAGFAVVTVVGFFRSVEYGLFGFKDSWSAPFAHTAFALELVTIAVFVAVFCLVGAAPYQQPPSHPIRLGLTARLAIRTSVS